MIHFTCVRNVTTTPCAANANAVTDDIFDVYFTPDTTVINWQWQYVGRSVEEDPACGNITTCRGGVFVPPSFGDTACLPEPVIGYSGLAYANCAGIAFQVRVGNAECIAQLNRCSERATLRMLRCDVDGVLHVGPRVAGAASYCTLCANRVICYESERVRKLARSFCLAGKCECGQLALCGL